MQEETVVTGVEGDEPGSEKLEELVGMIDQEVQKVEGRIRALREKISGLKDVVATDERLLFRLKKMRDASRLDAAAEDRAVGDGPGAKPIRLGVRKNSASALVLALAVEEIRMAGRPLHRGEVIKALKAKGKLPQSKDIVSLVSKVLGKNREIFEHTGDGYKLKDGPGYEMELDTAA